MKIIDNFLSTQQLQDLRQALSQEITYADTINGDEYLKDTEIQSKIYKIHGLAKTMSWNYLKQNNIVIGVPKHDTRVAYHVFSPGSCLIWHQDYYPVTEETIGVTLHLNTDWDDSNGGLFLYKTTPSDTTGYFISPIENRLVINYNDFFHSVSAISADKNIFRYSLQWFIQKESMAPEYR
jgi:hypothetical protein